MNNFWRSTFLSILLLGISGAAGAASVKVAKVGSGWELRVDGAPFWIKGVGCNLATGSKGEDYLAMARDLGANSVRTWGDTTSDYLEKADSYGLKVDVGLWLDPGHPGAVSYRDAEYCARMKGKILRHIGELKNYPAVLAWNIGNEVFNYTDNAAEKKAFGEFLENLVKAVHEEDPEHPIIYASASNHDIADLKRFVPSIDIVGFNTYSNVAPALRSMEQLGWNKPLVVTEYGTLGAWDNAKDKNNLPYDAFDHFKASNYMSLWKQIAQARGRILGGYAFVIGDFRNQDSLTWYNLNYHAERRASFAALQQAYSGKMPVNRPPKITQFTVDPVSHLKPGDKVETTTVVNDPENDPLTFEYLITDMASDPLAVQDPHYFEPSPKELGPGRAQLKAPEDPGNYRVYVVVHDGHQNAAVADKSIVVDAK